MVIAFAVILDNFVHWNTGCRLNSSHISPVKTVSHVGQIECLSEQNCRRWCLEVGVEPSVCSFLLNCSHSFFIPRDWDWDKLFFVWVIYVQFMHVYGRFWVHLHYLIILATLIYSFSASAPRHSSERQAGLRRSSLRPGCCSGLGVQQQDCSGTFELTRAGCSSQWEWSVGVRSHRTLACPKCAWSRYRCSLFTWVEAKWKV